MYILYIQMCHGFQWCMRWYILIYSLGSMKYRHQQKWWHSQVLERQSGEGAGLDIHNVVVAEVERFQNEEGSELLHRDPGDPVVCSENTDTHRSNKWQKTLCIWLVARTSLMFPRTQTVDSLNLPVVSKTAKKNHALAKLQRATQHEMMSKFSS